MSDNNTLFAPEELETDWEKEWQDMPEFVQQKQETYANIHVRFRNKEDLEKVAKLFEQQLNDKTKAIWFPKLQFKKLFNTRYVDES